jgi:hypothetical protein
MIRKSEFQKWADKFERLRTKGKVECWLEAPVDSVYMGFTALKLSKFVKPEDHSHMWLALQACRDANYTKCSNHLKKIK